ADDDAERLHRRSVNGATALADDRGFTYGWRSESGAEAPLATRRSLAAPGLSEALGGPDDQRVRLAVQPARAAAGRDLRSPFERVRGRSAHDLRAVAVPAVRAPRGGVGRPAGPAPHPDRRRPGSRARARVDSDRIRTR